MVCENTCMLLWESSWKENGLFINVTFRKGSTFRAKDMEPVFNGNAHTDYIMIYNENIQNFSCRLSLSLRRVWDLKQEAFKPLT